MRINRLALKNFKGFADRTFEFTEGFTLLLGDNGTGKTAVLDALAVAASAYLEGIEVADARWIGPRDVRRVAFSRQSVEHQLPTKIQAMGTVGGQKKEWVRTREKIEGARNIRVETKHIKAIATDHQARVRAGDSSLLLPLLAYHGTGRLWAEHKESIKYQPAGSRLEGYVDCISPKSSSKQFLSWFKTFEESVLKSNRDEDKAALEAFKNTVKTVVRAWVDFSFDNQEEDIVGEYEADGKRHFLPFRMFSDGFRNAVGMVADLAYRCIRLNPQLGKNAVTETNGLVLIDEIDLHLHPNWQKTFVGDLKKAFPKVQFVATSHSPFIAQSLSAKEVIDLTLADGEELAKDPFRDSFEEVAEQVMHVENVERSTRFLEMEKTAAQYFALIANGATSKTNGEAKTLGEKLDQLELLYSNDPAYVALMKAERALAEKN